MFPVLLAIILLFIICSTECWTVVVFIIFVLAFPFFFCLFWLQSSFGKLETIKSQALDETKHNDKDKAACGNIIYIAYHYSFSETVFSSVSAYQLICSACALSLLSFIMMCNEQNVNTNHTVC